MTRPSIWLISAAGSNFGDDLISIAWIRALRARFPDLHIFVDCVDATLFSALLKELRLDANVTALNLFWRTIRHFQPENWPEALEKLKIEFLKESFDFENANRIFENVIAIHFLGGGYINEMWPGNLLLLPIAYYYKKKYHIPLFWTGAGVHPLGEEKLFSVAEYIAAFDFISTRDKISFASLSRWNTKTQLSCDDLFLLSITAKKSPSEENILFINNQRDLRSEQFYRETIKQLAKIVKEWSGSIVYLSAFSLYDLETYSYLKELNPNLRLLHSGELIQLLLDNQFDIGKNAKAIVSRFHLHFLLMTLGIPGQYISPDDEYYRNKHQTLLELGSKFTKFTGELSLHGDSSPHSFKDHNLKLKETETIFLRLENNLKAARVLLELPEKRTQNHEISLLLKLNSLEEARIEQARIIKNLVQEKEDNIAKLKEQEEALDSLSSTIRELRQSKDEIEKENNNSLHHFELMKQQVIAIVKENTILRDLITKHSNEYNRLCEEKNLLLKDTIYLHQRIELLINEIKHEHSRVKELHSRLDSVENERNLLILERNNSEDDTSCLS